MEKKPAIDGENCSHQPRIAQIDGSQEILSMEKNSYRKSQVDSTLIPAKTNDSRQNKWHMFL